MSITTESGKKLEVKDAKDMAEFYGLPQSLVNSMFVEIGGALYPKEAALLHVGHKRGIQAIVVTPPKLDQDGEYRCSATIYPLVGLQKMQEVNRYPPEMRAKVWEDITRPTVEWGHASTKNVRMSTMQQWLPEMAIKRAVCRALRIFAGSFGTSYEELPDAELSQDEMKEKAASVEQVKLS